MIDPENPIVKLCSEGMMAEASAGSEAAMELFVRAWDMAANDFEACIAAHYVARHQASDQETLRWNQIAVDRALLVDVELVRSFFPSLYLCLGRSFEAVGDLHRALENVEEAGKWVDTLPDDGYGQLLRNGVAASLERLKIPVAQ